MLKEMDQFKSYLKKAYGRDFDIRVGVHYGEVISGSVGSGDDRKLTVIGDAVNIAARLEASAKPSGICISQTVFDMINRKIMVSFEDAGQLDLKNIEYHY